MQVADFAVEFERLRTEENNILAEGVTVAFYGHATSLAITSAPKLLSMFRYPQV